MVVFDPFLCQAKLFLQRPHFFLANFTSEGRQVVFAPVEVSLIAVSELVEHVDADVHFSHEMLVLFNFIPFAEGLVLDVAELEGSNAGLCGKYFVAVESEGDSVGGVEFEPGHLCLERSLLEEESQVGWPLVCEIQGLLVGQSGVLEEKGFFVGTPFCCYLPPCNRVKTVGEI